MYEADRLLRAFNIAVPRNPIPSMHFDFLSVLASAPVIRFSLISERTVTVRKFISMGCPMIFNPVVLEYPLKDGTKIVNIVEKKTNWQLHCNDEKMRFNQCLFAYAFNTDITDKRLKIRSQAYVIDFDKAEIMTWEYDANKNLWIADTDDSTESPASASIIVDLLRELAEFETKRYIPIPGSKAYKMCAKLGPKAQRYYELDLTKQRRPVIKPKPLGGTHASPCEHDRRGHYRWKGTPKETWVNACVVNKGKGPRLIKDYKL